MSTEGVRRRLAVFMSVVLGVSLAGLTPAAQVEAQATVVTSIPIDVAFAQVPGSSAFDPTVYNQIMTETARWWTTEARGRLVFTWTSYSLVPVVYTPSPCKYVSGPGGLTANTKLADDAARLLGHPSANGQYLEPGRRLVVFTVAQGCPTTGQGVTWYTPISPSFPGSGTIIIQEDSYSYPPSATETLIHELGHTFGLGHSSGGFDCKSGADGVTWGVKGDGSDCTQLAPGSQYGDDTSIMGSGNAAKGAPDRSRTTLTAVQKQDLGIISEGHGIVTQQIGTTTTHTIYRSDTVLPDALQGVRVVDDVASVPSNYVVDFPDVDYLAWFGGGVVPATGHCTVRVVRDVPAGLMSDTDFDAMNRTLSRDLRDLFLYSSSVGPYAMVDTLRADVPHVAPSKEMCLGVGETYTSWSGDVVVSVLSVATDRSSATVKVSYGPTMPGTLTSIVPTIQGLAQVGFALTAVPGSWSPAGVVLSCQWSRDGVPISGATAPTYTVVTADVGHGLSVTVTGVLAGYTTASRTSASVTPRVTYRQVLLTQDMSGDGIADIVAVDWAGNVYVVPQVRGGTPYPLGARRLIGTGFNDWDLVAPGDVNGDGRADLIGQNVVTGQLALFPGSATGLGALVSIGQGWLNFRLLAGGDLNGDGFPDLLGIRSDGLLYFYPGNGRGGFVGTGVQTGHGWSDFTLLPAGDANGDGNVDILGIGPTGVLWFYPGLGTGYFGASKQVGQGWTGFLAASGVDFTGDKIPDVVGRSPNGTLYLYPGKPGVTFGAAQIIGVGW